VDVVDATDEAPSAGTAVPSGTGAGVLCIVFASETLFSIGAVAGNGFRVSVSSFSSFFLPPSSFIVAGDGFRVGVRNTTNPSNMIATIPPAHPSGHKAPIGQRTNQLERLRVGAGFAANVRFTSSCNSLRVAGCISEAGPACSRRFLA
jgi:hypothetical protein